MKGWLPLYRAHLAAKPRKGTRKHGEGGGHPPGNSLPGHFPSAGTASMIAKSVSVASAMTYSPTSTGPQTLETPLPTLGQRPRHSMATLYSCPGACFTASSTLTGETPGRTVCSTTVKLRHCTQ